MRILLIDAFSGAAGDMFLGALIGLGVPIEELRAGLSTLGEPGWRLDARSVLRAGFAATKASVTLDLLGGAEEGRTPPAHDHDHGHHHHHHEHGQGHGHGHIHDSEAQYPVRAEHSHRDGSIRMPAAIFASIKNSGLPDPVKFLSTRIFHALAEAEAHVHGTTFEAVHFHEVGALDALIDVCGTALGLHLLSIDRVHARPIAIGSGMVRTAHGLIPVPAPATLELVRGMPVREGHADRELLTPTGAAILRALTPEFGALPEHRILRSAFGAGSDDPAGTPNVLRLTLAEAEIAGPPGVS